MTDSLDAVCTTIRVIIGGKNDAARKRARELLLQHKNRRFEILEVDSARAVSQIVLGDLTELSCCLVLVDELMVRETTELLADLFDSRGSFLCPLVILLPRGQELLGRSLLDSGAQDYMPWESATAEDLSRVVHNAVQRWTLHKDLYDRETHLHLALNAALTIAFEWDIVRDRVRRLQSVEEALPETADGWDTFEDVARQVHPDDRALFRNNVRQALQSSDGTYVSEFRVVRPDGTVRWLGERGRVDFDRARRPLRLIGISHDISERKRAETALAEQRRLYKSITDNASVALFIMDEQQQCVFMNPAAEELTGYTLAETQGRPLHDIVHHTRPDGSTYPLCECPIDQALPKNDREQGDEVFVHKDGHFYHVTFTASPLRDETGKPVGTVIEVQDTTKRKRAEEQLRQSESFYRQTLESIPGMVFTNTPDGVCDYISEQWAEFTGVPAHQQLGAGWVDVLHPEDRERAFAAWRDAVAERGQYDLEYRVRGHDGRYEWFKVRGRAIRDEAGKIIRWFGTAVNVDDLKQAEAALRARERELQTVADNIPDILTRFDRQFRHVFVNAAVERATTLQRKDFLGKTNRELGMPKALCDLWEVAIEQVFITGQPHSQEFSFEGPTATRYYSVRLVPEWGSHGEVAHVLGVTHDLTEQRLADVAVKESEERLTRAQQAGHIGTWDWDVTKDQVFWTDQAWQIFDPTGVRSRVTYEKWLSCIHPDDRLHATESAHRALLEGTYRDEYRVNSGDQAVRWVESVGKVQYCEGRAVRMLGTIRDVTERKLFEQTLHEADRHKDEFLAMLAHELRNPLAPICNAAQILKLVGPRDPQLDGVREMIERQVNHLVHLVDDLLDVSRVSRGKIVLQKETVDLISVLRQAVETSRPLMEARRHRLTLTIPDDPILLEGDATRLVQVVGNLLNNAAKYTDTQGEISLILEKAPGDTPQAQIRVRDNGRGIDPTKLHKLFDLFYQADRNLDRSEGGLGIGLSLVKNLVEMHGGSVEAHSRGRGTGSEFIVRLACLPSANRPVPAPLTDSRSTNPPLLILVVDDNKDSANSMAMLLQLEGHEVLVAHDGREGVELALRQRPRVILLDIGLPLLDGYQVCRSVRNAGVTETVIIAMTGYGQDTDRSRSLEAGFDAHLVKPIDLPALHNLLATHVMPQNLQDDASVASGLVSQEPPSGLQDL